MSAEEIAAGLSGRCLEFFLDVSNQVDLRLADRVEDRARQTVRRLGLVEHSGKPKRWRVTPLGLQVRALIEGTTHAD